MRIAVIGTGYVGLVTGTCLADCGNVVTCIDNDPKKLAVLEAGQLPIFEPGLLELVVKNRREERLRFTGDLAVGIEQAALIFICVGTPQSETGEADLTSLFAVGDAVAGLLRAPQLIVVKSTVPVGTNARLRKRMRERSRVPVDTASNPEFLKEGAAVDDCMKPDRVVVGVTSVEAEHLLRELYAPFLRTDRPFLVMSPESAEMTKYVANAMLAAKISFINEMANLCEKVGADINDVRRGIGHDARIGFQFLFPGPGFGGSCFPKDLSALSALARGVGVPLLVTDAVQQVNERQKHVLMAKIRGHFSEQLAGKTLAIWGLAFKPRTDDIREAPSLVLIRDLLDAGVQLRVHDPEAIRNVREVFGDRLTYCDRPYGALEQADGLVIVTEWQEFRNPDFELMRKLLRGTVLFDGRNLYEPAVAHRHGFTYYGMGRAVTSGRGS
jgi:UDPglucose 6-dehydrogenase